jgi:hypothetical protein
VAELMLLEQQSSDRPGRRLNLVDREREGADLRTASLGDYVWGLGSGDTCFSCGKGRLLPVRSSIGTFGAPEEQAADGRLVCEICGAEAGACEAA